MLDRPHKVDRAERGPFNSRYSKRLLIATSPLHRDFLYLMDIEPGVQNIKVDDYAPMFDEQRQRIIQPQYRLEWQHAYSRPFSKQVIFFDIVPYKRLKRLSKTSLPLYRRTRLYYRRLNCDFRVITERTIGGPRLKTAKRMYHSQTQIPNIPMFNTIDGVFAANSNIMCFGQLVNAIERQGFQRDSIIEVFYALVQCCHIRFDLNAEITNETMLNWVAVPEQHEFEIPPFGSAFRRTRQ